MCLTLGRAALTEQKGLINSVGSSSLLDCYICVDTVQRLQHGGPEQLYASQGRWVSEFKKDREETRAKSSKVHTLCSTLFLCCAVLQDLICSGWGGGELIGFMVRGSS